MGRGGQRLAVLIVTTALVLAAVLLVVTRGGPSSRATEAPPEPSRQRATPTTLDPRVLTMTKPYGPTSLGWRYTIRLYVTPPTTEAFCGLTPPPGTYNYVFGLSVRNDVGDRAAPMPLMRVAGGVILDPATQSCQELLPSQPDILPGQEAGFAGVIWGVSPHTAGALELEVNGPLGKTLTADMHTAPLFRVPYAKLPT